VLASTGVYVTGLISSSGNVNTGSGVSAVGNLTGAGITTTGSAGSISGSGNIIAGNFSTGGVMSATGNVTGNFFIGNGSQLTGVAATTVGTLASLSVTGNTTSGNLLTGGLISATGNITGGNILATTISNAASHTGGLVSVTGNVTGGNILATTISNAASHTGGLVSVTGNVTANNVTVANVLTVNSGAAATAIINGAGNAVGNIGSSSTYFKQVFAQATTALYADLAEMYVSDDEYKPGTVVAFGGNQEVTISTTDSSRRVAGVVSTNPAHVMNSGLQGEYTVAVALAGRVPTSVIGTVSKGDMMVAAGNGRARAEDDPILGSVIGKALEDFNGTEGVIEIVVGRL